jgi:hypothetical protein
MKSVAQIQKVVLAVVNDIEVRRDSQLRITDRQCSETERLNSGQGDKGRSDEWNRNAFGSG